MDIKWLEDFVTLARTRSFSRSSEARHVTQSAFSRRIQSLELWVGAPLVDRSAYPTTLTPAGRRFRETAEEALRQLEGARAELQAKARPRSDSIGIAALHSLALAFFPGWLRSIEAACGAPHTRLLADDFHNCIAAVAEGGYDFLLTYHHPAAPIVLDPALYPHRVVGADRLVAVRSPALGAAAGQSSPVLAYSPNSFLGRVTASAQAQAVLPNAGQVHVNENAMAEALKVMVLAGHGAAWVPRSLAHRELAEGALVQLGPQIELEVRLYRKAEHRRAAVERFWAASSEGMQDRNEPD